MIIYRAINKINGDSYIGKTVGTLAKRKGNHLSAARGNSQMYFHRAIRKYGEDNFEWEVLKECTSCLDDWEVVCIALYNTVAPNGYNLTIGGDGTGHKHSEETKKKISITKQGSKNPMFNIHRFGKLAPCYNKTAWNKGLKLGPRSKEICEKISKTKRGLI